MWKTYFVMRIDDTLKIIDYDHANIKKIFIFYYNIINNVTIINKII